MRRELKKRGVKMLKVVYSKEEALTPLSETEEGRKRLSLQARLEAERNEGRRQIPASNAFVPAVAGLIIAGEVIKDITGEKDGKRVGATSVGGAEHSKEV
jgi:tRNA A37 threonylcarbamoyladenosine dehydratase